MGFLSHDIFLARLLYLISVVYKNTSCVFPHTSPHNEELLTAHILQLCKVCKDSFARKERDHKHTNGLPEPVSAVLSDSSISFLHICPSSVPGL